MALGDVQRALAQLAIDRRLRDRFFADPVAVGTEWGLVADEARDLAQTPRRALDEFADSLRRKRRDQVRRVVPITARALGLPRFSNAMPTSRLRAVQSRISTTQPASSLRSAAGWTISNPRGLPSWPATNWHGARPRGPVGFQPCADFDFPLRGWPHCGSLSPSRLRRPWHSGGDRRATHAFGTLS
jgi:hypothetical protein